MYASADRKRCDLENIALTYVGNDELAHLVTTGVRLERVFRELGAPHAINYQLVPAASSWTNWRAGPTLATVEAHLPAGWMTATAGRKATAVWSAIKRGTIRPLEHASGWGPILVQIELSGATPPPIAVIIKPIMDGLVSALHATTMCPDATHLARIAREARANVAEVRRWLTDAAAAVLGSTQLVSKDGYWLPRDDRCVGIEVHVRATPEASPILHGQIVQAVAPREGQDAGEG